MCHTFETDIHKRLPACSYESGDFFALDMGGTNFRTVYARLSGKPGKLVMQLVSRIEEHYPLYQ